MHNLILILLAIFPYLQNPQPTQMTVMWTSPDTNQTGWVEYGIDSLNHLSFSSAMGLKDAFQTVYRVPLTNLQPGTTYHYRVASVAISDVKNTSLVYGDTTFSEVYSFTTPQSETDKVSCYIFDDIHSRDTLVSPMMIANNLRWEDADFVFFNGDMLNAIPSESEIISHLLEPYSKLFASSIPFFFTRGNHEYRNAAARVLPNYLTTPGTSEQHSFYYSFSWGPCFFIVLDAGEDKEDSDPEYSGLLDCQNYREKQVEWLQQQLQSKACKKANFRIVLMHIPFYSNTKTARFSVGDCRRLFLDLCNRYKVDAVVCGHTHKAGVLPANKEHHFPIIIGGGKDVTPDKATYCPAVINLQADAKSVNIRILDYYAHLRDSITLKK